MVLMAFAAWRVATSC